MCDQEIATTEQSTISDGNTEMIQLIYFDLSYK